MVRRRKRAPGSESAGYHYDATPKHPASTKTPTIAPSSSQAATSPAGDYAGAGAEYQGAVASLPGPARTVTRAAARTTSPLPLPLASILTGHLTDLLTPGKHTGTQIAEAAHRLGITPKAPGAETPSASASIEKGFENAASQIISAAASGAKVLGRAERTVATTPNKRVDSFLGRKTLGTPTVAEILKAASKGRTGAPQKRGARPSTSTVIADRSGGKTGGIRINERGMIVTPRAGAAARKLRKAQQRVNATARPDVSGLAPEERALLPYVLRAHKQYPDIPVSVQMAQIKQESRFNPLAVSSAGAFGSTQFMPETAASYDVKRGNSPAAIQSQITGQAHLLHDDNFATDPQGALSAYSGGYAAADYNNPILADAKASYAALDRRYRADPKARAQLQKATAQAVRLGINLDQAKGDVAGPSGSGMVWVRADAKGMVDWAASAIGTQEGTGKQLRWAAQSGLGGTEPWCGAFIAAGLTRRGLTPPPNAGYSGSYLDWAGGHPVANVSDAKPGDILVFGPSSFTSHVGLYVGNGQMISGNFSDEVAQSSVADEVGSAGLAGIVRPNYKGGKVQVQNASPLTGTLGGGSGVGGGSVVGGATVGAPGTARQQRAPAAAPMALPSSTSAASILPALFLQFQLGQGAEEGEAGRQSIKKISRRRV